MSKYISGYLFLLICSVSCKAQLKSMKYRIEYGKCNPVDIKREWLNDSMFIEQSMADSWKDTFLIKTTNLAGEDEPA
ncbi:MAG: hypothetical protein AAB221_14225, partial [Bacteroidota bacterium]